MKSISLDKLQKANDIKDEIIEIESFINLIMNGQKFDKTYGGQNMFGDLTLSAYIYTGSDNPRYEKQLNNEDIITKFVNAGMSVLSNELEIRKKEFEKIFNKYYE